MEKDIADTGAMCLSMMAEMHQIKADLEQIRRCSTQKNRAFCDDSLIQAATSMGYQARRRHFTLQQLNQLGLPIIARARDGAYFIVVCTVAHQDDKGTMYEFSVNHPLDEKIKTLDADELLTLWSGEAILLAPSNSKADYIRELDFA